MYSGLRAPLSGAYLARPVCTTTGYRYPMSSTLINVAEVHPEAWAGHGGQHADSGNHRYIAGESGYAGGGIRFESSICSGPVPDLRKLEQLAELQSVLFDVRSPMGAEVQSK